jgi:hypothetical protein
MEIHVSANIARGVFGARRGMPGQPSWIYKRNDATRKTPPTKNSGEKLVDTKRRSSPAKNRLIRR